MKKVEIERIIDSIDSKIIKYKKSVKITAEDIASENPSLVLEAKIRESIRLYKELTLIEHLEKERAQWYRKLANK